MFCDVLTEKALEPYDRPAPAVVVAELKRFQSEADRQPKVEVLDVAHVRALEVFRSPEPTSELNELFPMMRLVVLAVVKEAYVVVE